MRVLAFAVEVALAAGLTLSGTGAAVAETTLVAIEGAPLDVASVSLGAPDSVADSPPGSIQAPFITYGVDAGTAAAPVRSLFVPYATNIDGDPWSYGQKDNGNEGASFQTGTYHGAAVALEDGRLLAWDTFFADDPLAGSRRPHGQLLSDQCYSGPRRAVADGWLRTHGQRLGRTAAAEHRQRFALDAAERCRDRRFHP
jgi:hypothetical protein